MLYKIISVIIEVIFPKTPLEKFISSCSYIEFEQKLTPRNQTKPMMFFPFYYKDPFVRDCIIELKERDNQNIAKFFAHILFRFIAKTIHDMPDKTFFLVPVPQHISKTKEKGFCHTTTLTKQIYELLQIRNFSNVYIKPCIIKQKNIKKLHTFKSKQIRFNLIKNSMKTYITKQDAQHVFFIIDDVYTSGATFKEMRRSLLGCGAFPEHIFFVSIAH